MHPGRIGATLRALRRRRCLSQRRLGELAGLSQSTVSRVERGHLGSLSVDTIGRVFGVLDARIRIEIDWRGGAADRLLDQRHAELLAALANEFAKGGGWGTLPEVTYAHFGERGSIDLLGIHEATRSVAVAEVKSQLNSLEETLRRHDVKVRLAPRIVRDRLGWYPRHVSRILVLPEDRTARRRVAAQASVLSAALPARGHAIRAWLRHPVGPLAGIWFLPSMHPGADRRGVDRRT
jgi:transcriptional regulator with XRE-family HTH domain